VEIQERSTCGRCFDVLQADHSNLPNSGELEPYMIGNSFLTTPGEFSEAQSQNFNLAINWKSSIDNMLIANMVMCIEPRDFSFKEVLF
jgi:hypothetical protein